MTIETLQEVLLICMIINLGLFIFSFLMFRFMRDLIFKVHGNWYGLPPDKINETIYKAMVFYKICILFFNVIPYIALRMVA